MVYGGLDPLGYASHLVIGPRNLASLQIMFLKKNANFLVTTVQVKQLTIPLDRHSNFTHLQCVTVWVLHFIHNCHTSTHRSIIELNNHPVTEVLHVERCWVSLSQQEHFLTEIKLSFPKIATYLPFHPFSDKTGLLRVGGRECNSELSYSRMHPIILHGKHLITKLLVQSEHL